MKPSEEKRLKWQLTRERLRIEEPNPPPARRPDRRIGDILTDILKTEKADCSCLPPVLMERWTAIAGQQIAQHTYPANLREEILYIYTDHPGWLTEVRRLPKKHLLKKISSIPGIPKIKDVRFLLDPAIRKSRK
jgi:predicted nucleic acid-binding Zn ribbon protein